MEARRERVQADLVDFGKRVRRLRRAADLTQEQLAERAGIDARVVRYLEHAEREVGIGTAFLIANALGMTVAELFGN